MERDLSFCIHDPIYILKYHFVVVPQTFGELSARETIDPADMTPLQTHLDELESSLMDLEMYQV